MSRRAPSPTSTTYSGISTYRSDSYKPPGPSSRDQLPAVPIIDSRAIARNHYDELRRFLASHLAKEPLNSRSSAREKLTRLTKQQFQELSTDVFDELIRRNTNSEQNEVPFLPVRDDFHPKRNQARQKLATLPKTRFKDLSSDVFYELGRRYPEFKEPETPPETPEGDEDADKPITASPPPIEAPPRRPSQESNPYSSRRQGSDDVVGPLPDVRRKPSHDTGDSFANMFNQPARRPSEDTVRSFTRKASEDSKSGGLYRNPSQSTANSHGGHSTATSGMVIPNKSTIAEERIEVPYGNDEVDSASDRSRGSRGQRTISQGLGALGASLLAPMSPITDDEGTIDRGNRNRDTSDYYDKMSFGRASVTSSSGGAAFAGSAGREAREEAEKMRSEYEYKIATMQKKMSTLETDLSEANDRIALDDDRVRKLTNELENLRKRTEEQSAVIRGLQQDLEDAQDARDMAARDLEEASRRQGGSEGEVRHLRAQIEELERERLESSRRNSTRSSVDDMRGEVQTLVEELKSFIARNDELQNERESDQAKIQSLTNQVQEYKLKYQHAKTDLRNIKATSQLFLQQAPKPEDQLPVSPNGAILDIHVTAFQSATDSLLMAARSSVPSNVFAPMRSVVTAVTTIVDDLRLFEQRQPKDRMGVDHDTTKALRERAEATLSNLTVAAKNHAMGGGLSPVSLVDAAASHVSASVVAIIKTVSMRKSTEAEQERQQYLAMSGGQTSPIPLSNKGPTLRSIDGMRGSDRHGRTTSDASQWSNGGARNQDGQARRTFSDRSSNASPQPPTIFDTSSVIKNMNGNGNTTSEEGSDDAWEELKPYLDVQSESIVLPIRNLLSSIRSGASAAELNDNLTQIITIVSSIVAVCKDCIPASSQAQGDEIIRLLSDNCNKLSELQSQSEITKETRQAMASASFTVAKAMKELRSL